MATKLKDVQFAMQGELKEMETSSSLAQADAIDGLRNDSEMQTDVKYHVFKLVNSNRKGGVYINGIDDVFNPETKSMERIRLLTGVNSIWLKDQKDVSPEYVKNNLRSLHFIRGVRMLQIPEYDKSALEFARLCSHNIGSKSKKSGSPYEFYEFDAAKEEKLAFAREDFELEMAIEAKQAGIEPMKKHAAFLGIRLINDLGLPKGEDGIRIEYVRYAKKNPQYFKDTLGSKEVEIGWMIRSAVTDSKIEIGREVGKIYWANGGGMICVLPQQTDPIKYMIQLAMTNSEDGLRFLEQLQNIQK